MTVLKWVNKGKFFIYIFSFLIFILLNNLFTITVALIQRQEVYFRIAKVLDCSQKSSGYYVLFESYKALLFLIFIFFLSKRNNSIRVEFLTAYFIYDPVFLLSKIWELADAWLKPSDILLTSPQVALNYHAVFSPSISILLACFWSILLVITLKKFKQIGFAFLIKRIFIIPFSVILVSLIAQLMRLF